MAKAVQVYGKQVVWVGTGSAGAYEELGETEDGVSFPINRFYNPVPGDLQGGNSGDPIDEQFMGATVTGNLVLSKYDSAIWEKVEKSLNDSGVTNGTIADTDIGKLMLQGAYFYKIKFIGATTYVEFPCCLIGSGSDAGRGTKYTRLTWNFKAKRLQSSGVLYTKASNP